MSGTNTGRMTWQHFFVRPPCVSCWRSLTNRPLRLVLRQQCVLPRWGHDPKGRQPHWVRFIVRRHNQLCPCLTTYNHTHGFSTGEWILLFAWSDDFFWWSPLLWSSCSTFGNNENFAGRAWGAWFYAGICPEEAPSPMEWACRRSHWGLVWLHYHERWARVTKANLFAIGGCRYREKSSELKIRGCLSWKNCDLFWYSQLSFPVNLILSKYGKSITSNYR